MSKTSVLNIAKIEKLMSIKSTVSEHQI